MDKRILMVLIGMLLSACTSGPVRVHGADFSVDDAHIRVSDGYHRHYYRHYDDHYYRDGHYRRYYDDHHHGGYRSFCPPGQAKKGRC